MGNETFSVETTVEAPVEAVFAVLTDPGTHAAIDGTGWVREPKDDEPLTGEGQVFRMAMYHPNHPDGDYEMANRITAFEAPRTISWEPGQYSPGSDVLETGGWIWRYDLAPAGDTGTTVTLSYDWSAVPAQIREHIPFPPFEVDHLHNSLSHLAEIATSRQAHRG
ncbi:SRPBCC family protein [Pseudonocardia spinosispora]|uniref:SRPBCC family protein n=1 Tax=Pseudonocardia spinosispora TaxID=103441 RepID=UPI000425C914|nr:SRPBCC family protein [Pseudonocardia spinosispora]